MLKRTLLISSQLLCAFTLLCSSVYADENELINDNDRVGVSSRSFSLADEQQVQERRQLLREEGAHDETIDSANLQQVIIATEDSEAISETIEAAFHKSAKRALDKRATYYTSHNGAFHYCTSVSFFGDSVELEDGSTWSVRSSDWHKTLNWFTTDPIIILPNNSWSSYDFILVNTITGVYCDVNLVQGPYYHSYYRHWIVAIDYFWNEVWLEDGSHWKITIFDDSIMQKWCIGDTVIIGINDGFTSSSKPNILINVNLLNYCCANCQ